MQLPTDRPQETPNLYGTERITAIKVQKPGKSDHAMLSPSFIQDPTWSKQERPGGGGVTSRSIHILSVLRLVYSTVAKNRAISSISGSPLQKSHPTMILVWLQQMILRASNCSL